MTTALEKPRPEYSLLLRVMAFRYLGVIEPSRLIRGPQCTTRSSSSGAEPPRRLTCTPRSFHKALHDLEAIQTKRSGGAAPLARLDVDGLVGS